MKEEWEGILHSTWIKVVLIAIMIIPMAYAGVFLGSMWDPYGHTDKLPVAIVNQDQTVTYNGAKLHVGNDLVKKLKTNDSMDFQFVNASTAKKGLQDGSYYMTITIPKNFSYNATTLLQDNPKKMELTYETNPGTNYIASKMDETAVHKIKESVNASVTTTYADTLFSQLKTLSKGLQDAGNGSDTLKDGVDKTVDGNQKIQQNLVTLANSTLTFKDGANSLQDGLQQYVDGVDKADDGSYTLSQGLQTLHQKTQALTGGIDSLAQGSEQLNTGVQQYSDGVDHLSNGLTQVASNNDALNRGMLALSKGSMQAVSGSKQVMGGLEQMSYSLSTMLNPEAQQEVAGLLTNNTDVSATNKDVIAQLQNKIDAGTASDTDRQMQALLKSNTALLQGNTQTVQKMLGGLQGVQQGLDRTGSTPETMGLLQGMGLLQNGIESINDGIHAPTGLQNSMLSYTNAVQALQQGASQLQQKSPQLRTGASTLQKGSQTMDAQTPQLKTGVSQLKDGATTLYNGTSMLVSKNPQLMQGMEALQSGSGQLHTGAQQLATGSMTLGDGLQKVKNGSMDLATSLHDGAKQSQLTTTDKTEKMMAQPVNVKHKEMYKVESNGKAMAPYMMSVGLYVGCMAFTLMYPLLKNRSKTSSGFRLWLSKASVMFTISTIMAIIMIVVLTLVNGLLPLQFIKTTLLACLISAAFMSMIVFFNATCGKIGAFLMLIFMVFQLGGAAGTYPIETSSAFYQTIHPFMPFTYSVSAFRHTLAMGGSIAGQVTIFAGMILVFSFLTYLFYRWKASVSEEHFEKTMLAQFH